MLHLDVMTVTGKTLGENLDDLKKNGFYDKCDSYLEKVGLKREDVIRPFDKPFGTDGALLSSTEIFARRSGGETYGSAKRNV